MARRCIDAEQTRRFYDDVLGLPLADTVASDHVPSTGEHAPYFGMGYGSYVNRPPSRAAEMGR